MLNTGIMIIAQLEKMSVILEVADVVVVVLLPWLFGNGLIYHWSVTGLL